MLLISRQLTHDMKLRSLLLSFLPFSAAFRVPSTSSSHFHSCSFAHNPTRRPHHHLTSMSTSATTDIDILPLQDGSHNSAKVIITSDFSKENFRERLKQTLHVCRSQQRSSLWIEVPMSHASLIEEMQEFGLTLHHAQGTTASLNVWLMNGISNLIPEFATHHVGVGALVVNSRNEILCVRELRNNFRPWKLPGGLSDLGEDIPEAACREVLEETGIHCTFSSIISFRHTHNMAHGRSDLYFVCKLLPTEHVDENDGSPVIPTPVPCEEEIEAAAWVPMEDYKAMINGKDGHPMMRHVMRLYENDCEIKQTVVSSIVPGRRPSPIYGCHIDTMDDDKQDE